jgi:hypothetical protein
VVILLAAIDWTSHLFVKRSMGEQLRTFSNNSFWLVSVQLLDGVGAGIFGALKLLVIADLMRGTWPSIIGDLVRGSGHRLAAYPVMNSMAAFDGQLLHRP